MLLLNGNRQYQVDNDKLLGQGSFHIVYAGEILSDNNREVAIKYPKKPIKDPSLLELYRKEMINYKELQKSQPPGPQNPCMEVVDHFLHDMLYGNEIYKTPIVVMKLYKQTLASLILERSRKAIPFEAHELIAFIWDFLCHYKFLYKNSACNCGIEPKSIFVTEGDPQGSEDSSQGELEGYGRRYLFGDFAISKELKESIRNIDEVEVTFDFYSPPEFTPSL